ncbi:polymorphic toxin-type HINT domain-containing protein [Oerskovia sp. USHLN155]|uniref:polymorphic toxin-type HINT domain-containing protein n=1 Tax=Oerskovia sp. USHLN155 TaxID=3081288 RepID=UPI0030176BD0
MGDGSKKPIDEVKVGDEVTASDPETGEQEARRVTHVFVHEDTVTDLRLENGAVLETTEDHPFWSVTDGRFERADELSAGELVLKADGRTIAIDELRGSASRTAWAYNLSVDGIHTYHVGQQEVLVHNTCPIAGNVGIGPLPKHVQDVLDHVDANNGAGPAGFGLPNWQGAQRPFGNKEGYLPSTDGAGGVVKYFEYDVNPYAPGVNRGPERLITGTDGSAYYTSDHYSNFVQGR